MRPRVNGLHAKRPEPPPATMILEIEVGKVLPQRALTNRPRRPAAKLVRARICWLKAGLATSSTHSRKSNAPQQGARAAHLI